MSFKVEGLLGAEEMILNLDTTLKRRVSEGLFNQAHELRDLAARMAPIDEGHLEEAIKVTPEEMTPVGRGANGRFERIEYRVYIDMEMDAPHHNANGEITKGTGDKKVGDYAYYVHEHVQPAGTNELGQGSLDKQEADTSIEVGGAFMTRAAEEIEKTIVTRILSETAPAPRHPNGNTRTRMFHNYHNRNTKGQVASRAASTHQYKNPKFR